MRYRTKLYLALLGISIISAAFALTIVYKETKTAFLNEYSSKVLSIAATVAPFVEGDELEQITSAKDEESPVYKKLVAELRKARDANRREDVYVKWLYIYRPSPSNPELFLYVVDSEENPVDHAVPGDIYDEAPLYNLPAHFRSLYAPKKFIHDPTGDWLIASAPIHNSKNKIVGAVEADVKATDVIALLDKLLDFGLTALGISCVVAFTLAFFLARGVTRSLTALYRCVKEIERGNLNARAFLKTHDEFNELGLAINDMAKGLQERERLKTGFARYVSQHVLERLLHTEGSLKLEGERRKITVLFSDIRQFTTLSENLPPEQVVSLLNSYFERMIEVIFRNQGTLDKFLGDGLMVEFGAPLEDDKQEIHAVTCALEMNKELAKLGAQWEREGRPRFEIGVGIHTGFAIVGNIGSERRIEYTAIGDTVNVASRLQVATKTLNSPILISETTFSALPQSMFKHKSLGPLQLRGRGSEVNVYSILPFD